MLLPYHEAACHCRNTQTKGVWLWGEPDLVPAGSDGVTTAIIYVDTEGFESTGKSDAYDDRIFALSAIISSLLVKTLASGTLLYQQHRTGILKALNTTVACLHQCTVG